jgi:hypothetical protein
MKRLKKRSTLFQKGGSTTSNKLTMNQEKINKLLKETEAKSKVLTNEFESQQRADKTKDFLFKKVENPIMQGAQTIVDQLVSSHPYNKQYKVTPQGIVDKAGNLVISNAEVEAFNLNKNQTALKSILDSAINTDTGESLFKKGNLLKK